MRSTLPVILLLAVTPLLGLIALAPPAAARPCMEDFPCCYGVTLPDGTCVETPCGHGIWGPCPASPTSAPGAAPTCVTLVESFDFIFQVCADPRGDCLVYTVQVTKLGSTRTCVVPGP